MKLSTKFFCIAYIIVLLSTGCGGMILIRYINNTLMNARMERVDAAVNFAAVYFLSFADLSYGVLSKEQEADILRQIRNSSDSVVMDVSFYVVDDPETKSEIQSKSESESRSQSESRSESRSQSEIITETELIDHTGVPGQSGFFELYGINDFSDLNLENNEILSFFRKDADKLVLISVCRLRTDTVCYYLVLRSDFTELRDQCRLFWKIYGIVIFSVSVASGFFLYLLSVKITRPLKRLTRATEEIALGNYHKRVRLRGSDQEIRELSQSFNTMSAAIEERIAEITEESEKRSRFVADFTHELKTPMTAIIGYAQMLKSYDLDENEKKEAAGAIYSEARRLEKLSLQLLELYVYQNEEIVLDEVPLLSVAEQLNSTLKYVARKYSVAFQVEFQDEVVSANRVLLLSLLYNLADNAFKASDPQSSVSIYSRSGHDLVRIYVKDQGRGIAGENLKNVTEPFFREDKARSRKLGGAGLGLSLCKEIAALHGSELTIKSEQGHGTIVSFTLHKIS